MHRNYTHDPIEILKTLMLECKRPVYGFMIKHMKKSTLLLKLAPNSFP